MAKFFAISELVEMFLIDAGYIVEARSANMPMPDTKILGVCDRGNCDYYMANKFRIYIYEKFIAFYALPDALNWEDFFRLELDEDINDPKSNPQEIIDWIADKINGIE